MRSSEYMCAQRGVVVICGSCNVLASSFHPAAFYSFEAAHAKPLNNSSGYHPISPNVSALTARFICVTLSELVTPR